jgi:diguanylate cyclase (GGDEF)-like protein/PAS domain S-box-containing protein/putative nucleotidyltransferase with HDIG domain
MGDFMKDICKSKKQLIKELEDMRRKASLGRTGTIEDYPARANADLVSDGPNYRRDRGSLLLIRQAIDSATDAIGLSDSEGHHVYQNKAFTNLFEYTAEELAAVGNEAAFAVKSAAREVFGSIMSGRSWSGEVEMISKSGRVFGLFLRADAIKDDSGRIVGLVGVFTDIAERKRMEYELRKKHDELQLILDSIPAYVFYKDKDGKLLNINKAAMALAYAPKEKLLQKTVFDLIPKSADRYNRDDMEVIRSGQPKINIEESLELPSGTKWLKTDKLPIKDDDGNIVGLLGFSVDITDRKKAQDDLNEKESLLRSFFNSPGLVCGIVELEADDIRYITVNAAMSEMYELTPEAVSNKVASEIGTDRGIVDLFIKNYKKSRESNAPAYFEYHRGVGHEMRWFYVTATFLGLEPTSLKPRYAFVTTEITERRRMEKALRNSEEKLRLMFESIKDGIFIVDLDGKVIEVNTGVEEITGYSREQLLGQSGLDYIFPVFKDNAVGMLSRVIEESGVISSVELPVKTASGKISEVEANASILRDISGNPIGLIGVVRDITERKYIENALRDSEEKLRLTFASMADGVVVTDIEGKMTDVNEAQLRMFGFKEKSELIGKGGFDFLAVRDRGRALADMFKVYEQGFNTGAVYTVVDNNGREFECELSTAMLHDATGKPNGTVTIMRDVTERKKAEEAFLLIRKAVDSSSDAIGISDAKGHHFYQNKAFTDLFEYTAEDLGAAGGGPAVYVNQVVAREVFDTIMGGGAWNGEVEMAAKSGRRYTILLRADAIKDDNGKIVGLVGAHTDITQRKRIEDALKESEARYRLLAENVTDVIWTMDMNLKYTYVSPSVLNLRGYTVEEAMRMSLEETVSPDSIKTAIQVLTEELTEDHSAQYTYRTLELELKCKNGSTVWTEVKVSFLYDAERNRIGLLGITRDITERRQMDQKIRESEERYRFLADNVTDVIWMMDLDLKYQYVSPSIERMRGFTTEEFKGVPLAEYMSKETYEASAKLLLNELDLEKAGGADPGRVTTMELELKRKDGSWLWAEARITFTRNREGKAIGIMGITRDISERRKMQEALRDANEKLQVIFDSIGEAVTVVDFNGTIVDANKEALRLHGFKSKEEIVGKKSTDMVAPIDRKRAVDDAIKSLKSPYPTERKEYKLIDNSGREFDGEFNIAVIRGERGKPAGFIGIARDVSERKRMQEELKKSEEFFKEITENSSDVIVITDKDGVIKYCSRSTERFTGYKPEELIGKSAFKFIHPDDVQRALGDFGKTVLIKDTAVPNSFRIMHKDGSARCFDGLGKNLLDNPSIEGFIMNIRDVTERNKMEEALRNSEEKLRVMFDSMMDGIVVSDSNVKIVDVNKAALDLIGPLTKEELLGRNAMDVIRFKDQEAAVANLTRMFKEQRPQEKVEYSLILPGGRELEAEVSTAMMLDSAGNVVGFVNAIRDITERKIWENTLRESEEKYRNLVERERDVIVSVDALGFVKSVNSAVMSWGYTPDEVLKMNFLELIAPEWREVTAIQLQSRLLETGEHVGETMVVRKDGEQRPIEYSAVVIREEGKYAGAQAIVRDISERKKAEEALQAKERYFRAITDLSSGAALVVSLDGNIMDVTGGLERISGYSREMTLGRSALEFIHPDDLEKAGVVFNEAFRNPGKTVTFEARLKNAQGEWQWTESMITNLLDHHDVRGIVNHLVDLTERKKTEEDIRRHVERVEALYGVAQVISQASTLDTMLKDSLERVCAAMDTESGCVFMLDLDENSLKLKSYRGLEESIVEQFSTIELTDEGIEKIMQLQGPVTEIDETRTVADIEGTQRVTAELGRKSIAATPLFRGDDLQGFLVAFSSRERRFSSDDLELFKAIASEISIGINNLMLLEQTRKMSVTDELTGLYNRRYFFEMLDVEVNRSERTKRPFSAVMLDLDGFKEYNDKYGHSNGDAVLEAFSRTLKASVRKSDLAFRYGGDEFAIILPSADAERAKKIVQRARAHWEKVPLRQAKIFGGNVGFSSGIAEYPENAESPDGLIFLADAALYQAKKKGYADKLVSELRTLSTDVMDVATQDQVYALAATVDARDPYTYGHSQRVAEIAMLIGKQVGLSSEDLAKLHAAALLHDIGKVGVPDAILTKTGKPTPEEWDVIKKHCAEGARILGYVKELSSLVPTVLHHHEWYDGSGYPGGLKGMDIPSGARITTVADSYDTMVTKRPYREVISPSEACEELKRKAGTQFDPAVVDVWCKLVEKEGKQGR